MGAHALERKLAPQPGPLPQGNRRRQRDGGGQLKPPTPPERRSDAEAESSGSVAAGGPHKKAIPAWSQVRELNRRIRIRTAPRLAAAIEAEFVLDFVRTIVDSRILDLNGISAGRKFEWSDTCLSQFRNGIGFAGHANPGNPGQRFAARAFRRMEARQPAIGKEPQVAVAVRKSGADVAGN